MEKHCFKFYRVCKNDTAVTEVSFNDFKPVITRNFSKESLSGNLTYSLVPAKDRFYGYELKTQAMEMAKAGALKHLEELIAEGPKNDKQVYQYRFDHYDDLNINLTDSNIRGLKKLALNKIL